MFSERRIVRLSEQVVVSVGVFARISVRVSVKFPYGFPYGKVGLPLESVPVPYLEMSWSSSSLPGVG